MRKRMLQTVGSAALVLCLGALTTTTAVVASAVGSSPAGQVQPNPGSWESS